MEERIGVVGLGYVGLPVALAFAKVLDHVVGFDLDALRIAQLRDGHDRSGEQDPESLREPSLRLTASPDDLAGMTVFIVTVPTPIDRYRTPDLGPLRHASELVARVLRRGCVVIYESTVYPGVTEEVCGPILEKVSGLRCGDDFKLAYSPERINPGDRTHTLDRTVKVVSGQDEATLERVANLYASIVPAGVHRAPSIMVAEAAKVIENTQRDLNIALMNELALIFDRLGLRTADVLDAAGTKWNFLPFRPGLVGGHCIGVDPYYLTTKAEDVGYHPQVILAGRRINDGMGTFIAQRTIKLLIASDRAVRGSRVGILGVTFKEDVADLRNSRVPDIVAELREFGAMPIVTDPTADPNHARDEYGLELASYEELKDLDALILAVAHHAYIEKPIRSLLAGLRPGGVVVDVKSVLDPTAIPNGLTYWSL